MKLSWWKILCIIILCYAFLGGLLMPLKPGILNVNPTSVKTGSSVEIQIDGYNTTFEKSGLIRCWLKFDSTHFLIAKQVKVLNDRKIAALFQMPNLLPSNAKLSTTTILIDDNIHGTILRPDAIFVSQDSITSKLSDQNTWTTIPKEFNKISYITFPFRNILEETIRNTYFHVPLWFAMIVLFGVAVYYQIKFLRIGEIKFDDNAKSYTTIGLIFGILGIATGAIWAKFTWGQYWSGDVKQNMSAICLLIYLAYFVLRSSFDDEWKAARLSSVYGIFAFVSIFPLLFIIPRMRDSLHPGNGGNPALGSGDLDNTMRLFFYPSVIGFIMLGIWIATLLYRYYTLKRFQVDSND